MKNLVELEKEFGSVEYKGKKYILTSEADITNRIIPGLKNYNDVDCGEEYEFEMAAGAVDEKENEFIVYWIFTDIKGNQQKELDSFDYSNVDRVEER